MRVACDEGTNAHFDAPLSGRSGAPSKEGRQREKGPHPAKKRAGDSFAVPASRRAEQARAARESMLLACLFYAALSALRAACCTWGCELTAAAGACRANSLLPSTIGGSNGAPCWVCAREGTEVAVIAALRPRLRVKRRRCVLVFNSTARGARGGALQECAANALLDCVVELHHGVLACHLSDRDKVGVVRKGTK